jgi:hypothetical protein
LPLIAGTNSKIVLFADDTSTIITSSNQVELKSILYKTLSNLNLWFKANLLSLNINKTYFLHFRNNKNIDNTLEINYLNKTMFSVPSVKFLGLLVGDSLSWDKHVNQIASKLSSACYAVWALTPLLSKNALKLLHFSYAHSIISYDIIFWGTSAHSIKIFRLQKKILRIMTKSKKQNHAEDYSKKWKYYLSIPNIYIPSQYM